MVDVHHTDGQDELFLVTHNGYGLWFDEEEVSVVGVRAAGVKGINLKEDDYVIGGKVLAKDSKESILIVTQRGAMKKMKLTEFEKTAVQNAVSWS